MHPYFYTCPLWRLRSVFQDVGICPQQLFLEYRRLLFVIKYLRHILGLSRNLKKYKHYGSHKAFMLETECGVENPVLITSVNRTKCHFTWVVTAVRGVNSQSQALASSQFFWEGIKNWFTQSSCIAPLFKNSRLITLQPATVVWKLLWMRMSASFSHTLPCARGCVLSMHSEATNKGGYTKYITIY